MSDPVSDPVSGSLGGSLRPGLDNALADTLADRQADVDVLVVGLGITGAGVALDAATRGLRVLAVDAHDLAFGTSRWSSKLVHGGLRYLASGQVGVAHESAVERGILMQSTAPHLTHPMPALVPLGSSLGATQATITRGGLEAGDLLRRAAGTPSRTLPRPRRLGVSETLALVPSLRRAGLRGSLLSWDGRLEDDARLVTTVARTAASYGADVRTHVRVLAVDGEHAELRDELTGAVRRVRARVVVNAAGVWAGELVDDVRLRPSRGTHLVLRAGTLAGPTDPSGSAGPLVSLYAPVPGHTNRFVLVLPQPDGTVYVGLTDEPVTGPAPDVPEPTEPEIGFLLDVVGAALERPLHRDDVVGAFAGLRPLLDSGEGHQTADLSRRHAVLSGTGRHARVVTVVGGKLTTYRRMAQDAVDTAVRLAGLTAAPCRTHRTPLLGAAPRPELARLASASPSPRLVRRYGTDADAVLRSAHAVSGLDDAELLAPVADGVPTCLAELLFGLTHEGAADLDDLLDRRTRVGLVPADRERAVPAAERALRLARTGVVDAARRAR